SCTSRENSFPFSTNIASSLLSKAFASSFCTFLLNAPILSPQRLFYSDYNTVYVFPGCLLGLRSVSNKQGSPSSRSSKYLFSQIAQRTLKYTSLPLSPLPCTITGIPIKLISSRFNFATSPILQPVELKTQTKLSPLMYDTLREDAQFHVQKEILEFTCQT